MYSYHPIFPEYASLKVGCLLY